MRRKGWEFLSARLVPILGEGAIFGSGLAFGAAGMLLYRQEPLKGLPAMMIAIGLGGILAKVIASLLEWAGRSRPFEPQAPI